MPIRYWDDIELPAECDEVSQREALPDLCRSNANLPQPYEPVPDEEE